VRTLCDIGETCRRYGSAIDWNRIVTQADAYDVAKQLYHSLRLARDLVGASVPSSALQDLWARFSQLPLEDPFIATVARRAVLSEDQSPATASMPAAHLLATRRAREGVIVAGRLLARSCRARVRRLVRPASRATGSGGSDASLGAGASEASSSGASQALRADRPSTQTVGEVGVTYDPFTTDGVGSQLLRI